MTLATRVGKSLKKLAKRKGPLWLGPESDQPDGGVTQSIIGSWIVCRERTRIKLVEGIQPTPRFSHRMEYGSMGHVCEEVHATNPNHWQDALKQYARDLAKKFPDQGTQVEHWYHVCKTQFPIYLDYWAKSSFMKGREVILREKVFQVPYTLPSGRTVYLRGKWDGVDLIKEGKNKLLFLRENKFKGDIDLVQLRNQLQFDLQTMLYLIALEWALKDQQIVTGERVVGYPLAGVWYNVVRRPLSGGMHSIRQHQPSKSNPTGESLSDFYARLGGLIQEESNEARKEKRDCHYFARWDSRVSQEDIQRFKDDFLNPCLEQMCDWYTIVTGGDPGISPECPFYANYRTPYGIYNPLLEDQSTEMDHYLATGSMVGMTTDVKLFQELQ